jgi:hypothetical protein
MANATLRYRQAQYKSCPRERDAHTTVHHFYLDKLLVPQEVKSNIQQAFWRLRMVGLFAPCCTRPNKRKQTTEKTQPPQRLINSKFHILEKNIT